MYASTKVTTSTAQKCAMARPTGSSPAEKRLKQTLGKGGSANIAHECCPMCEVRLLIGPPIQRAIISKCVEYGTQKAMPNEKLQWYLPQATLQRITGPEQHPFFIYLLICDSRTEPQELWQGSGMKGPEPPYASHRTQVFSNQVRARDEPGTEKLDLRLEPGDSSFSAKTGVPVGAGVRSFRVEAYPPSSRLAIRSISLLSNFIDIPRPTSRLSSIQITTFTCGRSSSQISLSPPVTLQFKLGLS